MKPKVSVLISVVFALAAVPVLQAVDLNFVAHLSGDEVVPPVDTEARGQARFHLPEGAGEIGFRLIVANIEDVTRADIHVGPREENGPEVARLYPTEDPRDELVPGPSDGVIVTGTISVEDLVGTLEEAPLEDLLELMIDGDTYVNVHTQQFPGGEVRGQIELGKVEKAREVRKRPHRKDFKRTSGTFVAPLSGEEEVPPVDTPASGNAVFKVAKDGASIDYRLLVANIYDVTQAHIHLAPPGMVGPVVAWLYPAIPPAEPIPGRSDEVLATGTITAADLVGPLAGARVGDLVDEMILGNTYVNVHTSQNPDGEIRGRIRQAPVPRSHGAAYRASSRR